MAPRLSLDDDRHKLVVELEAHFDQIGHPALHLDARSRLVTRPAPAPATTQGTPHDLKTRCRQPRVATCQNFLSREECAHLVNIASQSMGRPGDYELNTDNGALEASLVDGSGRSLRPLDSDTAVRVIEQRMAATLSAAPEYIKPVSIICYQPGEEYRPHVDYFRQDQLKRAAQGISDVGGQRVATILLCLKAADTGAKRFTRKAACKSTIKPACWPCITT
ncbi:MAG: hypothetical protein RQ741_02500 [Wenzhouxiangellaceae bacterium]|nr:hypothetical protein [Wenzhouxiangellaceae bacterium]